jgi:hypothetical protein
MAAMAGCWQRYGELCWGWQQALEGWRANPLAHALDTSRRRRQAAQRLGLRAPQLLGCSALLSLLVTACVLLAWQHLHSLGDSPFFSRSYGLAVLGYGSALLLTGAGLACLYWLLLSFQAAAEVALSFLQRQEQRQLSGLDDTLSTTPLSAQELVLGLLRHALAILHPALLSCSLVVGVFCGLVSQAGSSSLTENWLPVLQDRGWGPALLIGGLFALQYYISGLLAACYWLLQLSALGSASRSPLLPRTGALMQVLLQLGLLILGVYFIRSNAAYWLYVPTDLTMALEAVGEVLLVLLLLGYLARRSLPLRAALAWGMPLVLAVLVNAPVALGVFYSSELTLSDYGPYFIYAGQMMALASPVLLGSVSLVALNTIPLSDWLLAQLLPWFILMICQGALVVAGAELARDALLRRAEEAA